MTQGQFLGQAEISAALLAWLIKLRGERAQALAQGSPLADLQLDSLEAVRFVAYLQHNFRIKVAPRDYLEGNSFESLRTLTEFVAERQRSRGLNS